jgi:transposase
MTDLTHNDLKTDIDKLDTKLERIVADLHALRVEILAATQVHATKIEQHDRDITHAFDAIHKLEDRSWRTGGAVILGTLSFIGTAGLAILTFLL